jgi:hypothetical protein
MKNYPLPQHTAWHRLPERLKNTPPSQSSGLNGTNYVFVSGSKSHAENGVELLEAYEKAKQAKPNNECKSHSNRMTVLVAPGIYDLSRPLDMDTEFVDLVGLTTDAKSQYIQLKSSTDISLRQNHGTIRQSANDVRITNVTLDFEAPGDEYEWMHWRATDSAAYFPESNLPKTVMDNVHLVMYPYFDEEAGNYFYKERGWLTRKDIEYSGKYSNITTSKGCQGLFSGYTNLMSGEFTNIISAGPDAFSVFSFEAPYTSGITGKVTNFTGSRFSFNMAFRGILSGTIENCKVGYGSFDGYQPVLSGTFINCEAGYNSFGTFDAELSGTFVNCKSGDYSFGLYYTTLSGNFINCESGEFSFGAFYCNLTGLFKNCKSGLGSFSFFSSPVYGTFIGCEAGRSSFSSTNGSISGYFENCTAGDSSFGSTDIVLDGTFKNCKAGYYSFGFLCTDNIGTFINCESGYNSFGNSETRQNPAAFATFKYCTAGSDSFIGVRKGDKAIFCNLTHGDFQTVGNGGKTVYCIDGELNTNNQ